MLVSYEFAIYYMFLLDIQCTTFYIEKRSVKRANNYFIICSKFTPTHIIFKKTEGFFVWATVLLFLLRRVKNI